MTHVNTGELLNFQDYSPEHNERSARIDVEAVHTNQYNTMSTSNYNYEEPKPVVEEETPQAQSKPLLDTNNNFIFLRNTYYLNRRSECFCFFMCFTV